MQDKLFTNTQLKKLIIPLMIEQFLAIFVGVADTIMVSSLGDAAVSGLSIVNNIGVLIINIFAALATGGAVVASQYVGINRLDKASESIKQLIYSLLVITIGITSLCIIFNTRLLYFIFGNVASDVMENAKIYFFLSSLSYPGIALYNCGAAAFRAMGNSKISMRCSLVMNGLNIIGNALLIYVFKMGVFGAGLATLISRFVGMFIILKALMNKNLTFYISSYLHYRPDFSMIKKNLIIGIPNGFENGLFQAGKVMVQRIVTTIGTVGIAGYALANNITEMMCIPGLAVGLAMVTVIGQCAGKEDYEQAKYYIKKLMVYSQVSMILVNLFLVLTTRYIYLLYDVSEEAKQMAFLSVLVHGFFASTVWPMAFTMPNAFRASNNATFTMAISIFSMFAFRILFAYIFICILGYGLPFMFVAMGIDWIFRFIVFFLFYKSNKWQKKRLV